MLKFLRKLFELRHKEITLLLWDDHFPDQPQSFNVLPLTLFRLITLAVAIAVLLLGTLFYLTPLGNLVFNRSDTEVRNVLLDITQRVSALKDSLATRDAQLENMKAILRTGSDTTFAVGPIRTPVMQAREQTVARQSEISIADYGFLRQPDISFVATSRQGIVFPFPSPVQGTFSQEFRPDVGHFGIDIAATAGTPFRSIADGVVINTEWTINYGYILHIQHDDGYLSIFKHSSTPFRKTGDFIRKGDILGTVSNSGIISSGPHLHFELWRNGQPLNPVNYMLI